jgi:hypothetical protein
MSTAPQDRPAPPQPGGTVWDAPNQQVVREDQSGPGIDNGTKSSKEPATK